MANEKVLLVDDEEVFVEVLSQRLETRGVKVEWVTSGADAVAKAKAQRFDAIVLDLAMPGMDGIETLTQLREIDPNVQVMLLTGRATLKKGLEAMKLGAMDFLEKPIEIEDLMNRIRTAKTTTDQVNEKKTQALLDDILKTKGW
jgi:two-component system OmpR family response regulator